MTNSTPAPLPFNHRPWYYCTYRDNGCAWHSGEGLPDQTRVQARKLLSDHMSEEHNR